MRRMGLLSAALAVVIGLGLIGLEALANGVGYSAGVVLSVAGAAILYRGFRYGGTVLALAWSFLAVTLLMAMWRQTALLGEPEALAAAKSHFDYVIKPLAGLCLVGIILALAGGLASPLRPVPGSKSEP